MRKFPFVLHVEQTEAIEDDGNAFISAIGLGVDIADFILSHYRSFSWIRRHFGDFVYSPKCDATTVSGESVDIGFPNELPCVFVIFVIDDEKPFPYRLVQHSKHSNPPSFKDNTITYNFLCLHLMMLSTHLLSSSVFSSPSQINVLNFIIKCDLTSYAQLVHWILLCRIPSVMLILLLLLLLVMLMVIHVVLDTALLRQCVAIAANHLERVGRKHWAVDRFKVFWCGRNALREIRKLGRWQLMHRMMVAENRCGIALRMNRQCF